MLKSKIKKTGIKIMAGLLLALQLLVIMPVNQIQPGEAAICGGMEDYYDHEDV